MSGGGGGGSDVLKQLKRQKVLGTVIVTFHTFSKLIGFINTTTTPFDPPPRTCKIDADASVYFVLCCSSYTCRGNIKCLYTEPYLSSLTNLIEALVMTELSIASFNKLIEWFWLLMRQFKLLATMYKILDSNLKHLKSIPSLKARVVILINRSMYNIKQ